MPIKIPNMLPARKILESENVFVMTEERAMTQDIRPLKIAILNLMPTKVETETQLLRLLGNSPLQIEPELLQTATHNSTHTSHTHLSTFYKTFDDVRDMRFDGMIITGAPVETMRFEEVDYWDELKAIMNWTKTNVYSTLHICWGAQAGLYHHYGVQKNELDKKLSGIYRHTVVDPLHPLMRGFDDRFFAPHSRYTYVRSEDIDAVPELVTLARSDDAGVAIIASKNGRQVFCTGHLEYDRTTLANEYFRDLNRGLNPAVPVNYFPDDDPAQTPFQNWRSYAHMFFANWLNYYVYQQTPYDLKDLIEISQA